VERRLQSKAYTTKEKKERTTKYNIIIIIVGAMQISVQTESIMKCEKDSAIAYGDK